MPVGITAKGAQSNHLQNVNTLSAEDATKALENIKGHLSIDGKAKGVLSLVNRTQAGTEMQLKRKNGFQLFLRGMKNQRLNDTQKAIDTLLRRAGLPDAAEKLAQHLKGKDANHRNRVSAQKLLAILREYLPDRARETDSPAVDIDEVLASAVGDNPQDPAMTIAEDSLFEPSADFEMEVMERQIQPQVSVPRTLVDPAQTAASNSLDELLAKEGVVQGRLLGSGAFGSAHEILLNGTPCVLKTFKKDHGQKLSLDRGARPNEAIAAYLTSKKDPAFALQVNVAQPKYFLVSVNQQFQKVTPIGLRALIKSNASGQVLCHGLIMPKAPGEEVHEQSSTLTPDQRRQLTIGTIQSLKKLNQRGFVHRDLKPENMYFDKATGTTTLIDTGMLHKVSKHKQSSRYIRTYGGTPLYMHPRAVTGLQHGTETDLYAAAVMALELEHPVARKYTHWIVTGLRKLREKGETVDKGISVAALNTLIDEDLANQHPHSAALRRLKDAINNPKTQAGFAMMCFEYANRPVTEWADREKAQAMYDRLLRQPYVS